MRSWADPVTEISVTGLKIFLYERGSSLGDGDENFFAFAT